MSQMGTLVATKNGYDLIIRLNNKQQRIKTKTTNKSDAKKFQSDFCAKLNTGDFSEFQSKKIKFEEFAGKYMEDYRKRVKASSIGNMTCVINVLLPSFGETWLDKITSRELEEVINIAWSDIKPSSYNVNLVRVKMLFKFAVRKGYLLRNPSTSLETKKVPRVAKIDSRKIYSQAELQKIIDACDPEYVHVIRLAAFAGLRQGELLALKWNEAPKDREENSWIDIPNRKIFVRQTYFRGVCGTPKSVDGRRDVMLPSSLVPELAALKLRSTSPWVVPNHNNGQDRPLPACNLFTRIWRPALIRAGVPILPFHSLRHFSASSMIASGMQILTVSAQLGHSSPSMTLNVYASLFDNKKQADLDTYDSFISSSSVVQKS